MKMIEFWFLLNFVPRSPIDNKRSKPLPEPMMTQFIDAYMWHQGEMS